MVVFMTDVAAFAEWLSREMADRKVNQSQLAAYLGIHPSAVNRWVSKGVIPNPATCARIAEVLHIDPAIVMRHAGHLRAADAMEAPAAIPAVRAILDEMSEEEQRRFALPALRLAEQLLRESRGEAESSS